MNINNRNKPYHSQPGRTRRARYVPPPLPRLLSHTEAIGECLIWQGAFANGIPRCWYKGRQTSARAAIWLESHPGQSLDGRLVRPRCGNPKCVAPAHAYLGDKYSPNEGLPRHARKVTVESARQIILARLQIPPAASVRMLADEYGISPSTVSAIANGRHFADLYREITGGDPPFKEAQAAKGKTCPNPAYVNRQPQEWQALFRSEFLHATKEEGYDPDLGFDITKNAADLELSRRYNTTTTAEAIALAFAHERGHSTATIP